MNIMHSGVMLIAYLFIVVIFFIVISDPFDDIMDNMDAVNLDASDGKIEYHSGIARTVFNMCFALAAIIPTIWFVAEVFREEPDRPGGYI